MALELGEGANEDRIFELSEEGMRREAIGRFFGYFIKRSDALTKPDSEISTLC